MDKILVRGLQLQALVGVWKWERRNRQRVMVDLELGVDIRRAAQSDRIHDTVDYSRVVAQVKELVEGSEYYLVEPLAEAIAQHVLTTFPVLSVQVRVTKPGIIPGVQEVGVELTREREQPGA